MDSVQVGREYPLELCVVDGHLVHGLDLEEVVGELSRYGAVEPRLEAGRDVLSISVLLADLSNFAVHVLYRHLREEVVDMFPDLLGADKEMLVEHVAIVLDPLLEALLPPPTPEVK